MLNYDVCIVGFSYAFAYNHTLAYQEKAVINMQKYSHLNFQFLRLKLKKNWLHQIITKIKQQQQQQQNECILLKWENLCKVNAAAFSFHSLLQKYKWNKLNFVVFAFAYIRIDREIQKKNVSMKCSMLVDQLLNQFILFIFLSKKKKTQFFVKRKNKISWTGTKSLAAVRTFILL